jgi:hypothetical protein
MNSEQLSSQNPAQGQRNDSANESYEISEKTQKAYSDTVKGLIGYSMMKREGGSHGMSDWFSVTAVDLVEDLMGRTDIRESTRENYVYALFNYLQGNSGEKECAQALECLRTCFAESRLERKASKAPVGKRKETRVIKCISKIDLDLLLGQLTEMGRKKSIWALRTQFWLQAGLATGIRPGEWEHAKWIDEEKNIIRVVTGKVKKDTEGYLRKKPRKEKIWEKPVTRDVPIESVAGGLAVKTHMDFIEQCVRTEGISMTTYRQTCSHTLQRARESIWGNRKDKNYTLYIVRRQYSANTKAAYGGVETARRMGHSRPDTPSASSYGSTLQAHSRTGENYRVKGVQRLPYQSPIQTSVQSRENQQIRPHSD